MIPTYLEPRRYHSDPVAELAAAGASCHHQPLGIPITARKAKSTRGHAGRDGQEKHRIPFLYDHQVEAMTTWCSMAGAWP